MVKNILHACMLLTLVLALQSCVAGARDNPPATINGTIRVVGNEPLIQVVIRMNPLRDKGEKNRDTLILGPLAAELRRDFQGRVVTLEGGECASPSPRFSKCFNPTRIIVE